MIGSGTYANNKTCAVSCTGHGEVFIRAVAAFDVHAHMAYKGEDIQTACEQVVLKTLIDMEGEGGLIAVDAEGNAAMVFNSAGMYRGVRTSDGRNEVAIYK
jgi:beta-aspartyl-peptidase (threonine type)